MRLPVAHDAVVGKWREQVPTATTPASGPGKSNLTRYNGIFLWRSGSATVLQILGSCSCFSCPDFGEHRSALSRLSQRPSRPITTD